MTTFLTKDELFEMTEMKNGTAQARALRVMGYTFDVAPSGAPKLLRSIVQNKQAGASVAPVLQNQAPNRDALAAMCSYSHS